MSSTRQKRIFGHAARTILDLLLLTTCVVLLMGRAAAAADLELHPPVPLYDENGDHVLDSGKPYSSRKSCGNNGGSGCHDYESITRAYHFEMGRDEARDNFGVKRGLPHLVSPGYFGGYACMGGSNPDVLAKKVNDSTDDFADRGSAGWVQRCNSCHPGGGWMEKDRYGRRYDETDPSSVPDLDGDYYNRGTTTMNTATSVDTVSMWDWKKSGVVEADCFICHGDFTNLKKFDPQLGLNDGSDGTSSALDHFKALRGNYLDSAGFFRYMGTAILEFLNLNTTADETLDKSVVTFGRYTSGDHSVHTRTKPAYSLELDGDGQPVINWNASAFDADGKVTFPMLRFPGNDNCMYCHRTSNSRRGFYGFGEGAMAIYSSDGTLFEDYRDDVHKGKTWTENDIMRNIENCNSCHARNYYRPAYVSTDLDADHNILKGNSDMDVRNDLDYNPAPKSCEYCHNDADNPAIPSGHSDMLSAHKERWKAGGDMAGYPQDALDRITKTHLDVVSCQACHITDKVGRRGKPIQIMYRYRSGGDGTLKIIPYNPRIRYYWKDRNSGRILNKTERNSVFKLDTDDDGNKIGVITDPISSDSLGTVSARYSHGSWRFGEPSDYDGYIALKRAYDNLLAKKGVSNPDTVMVWTESNQYVMSHNTRPATSSLQCEDCHNRKQDGSFSSLVSPEGLLGENNVKTVTTLPDRRLVDEGIVVLDMPYMKVDDSGNVTENVSDILYVSKIDPSLTVLKAASAKVMMVQARHLARTETLEKAGISGQEVISAVEKHLGTSNIFLFKPNYGQAVIRNVAVMVEKDDSSTSLSDLLFSTARMEVALSGDEVSDTASAAGYGGLVSQTFSLEILDATGDEVTDFSGKKVVVKIPYDGDNTNLEEVKVITSSDGVTWSALDRENVISIRPKTTDSEGYIVFVTTHFSYHAVSDTTATTSGDDTSGNTGGGGGGCFIATAAYGSYEEAHVQILRKFRDRILLESEIGKAFVDAYYTYSPPMAEWIAEHDTVRAIVRVLLLPLYGLAYFLLKLTLLQQVLVIGLATAGAAALIRLVWRARARTSICPTE